MKKKVLWGLPVVILLAGCALPGGISDIYENMPEVLQNLNDSGSEEETSVSVVYDSDVPKVTLDFDESEHTGGWYYDNLSEEEQTVYNEMYIIFRDMESGFEVSTLDTDLVERVGTAVINDHPEFYYLTNYSYSVFSMDSVPQYITVKGIYSMDESEKEAADESVREYVTACVSDIPESADDYEKAKAVYDYIVNTTDYVSGAEHNQDILSVCIYHQSVCNGYAKTFQYIMRELGFDVTIVTGYAGDNGEKHAWNAIKIDGDWYNADPTWGDNSYSGSEDMDEEFLKLVNYNYFLVPDEWLDKTHRADADFEIPECTETAQNYYVRNGLYFENTELEKMHDVFAEAISREDTAISLKMSDDEVYEDWIRFLFDESHLFDFTGKLSKVYYVTDAATDTLTVLLK